jgi:hypothetical protein
MIGPPCCNRGMVARAAVVWAVVLGVGAPLARAEPGPGDALIWRAPVGCPGGDDVRARIERRLGAPLTGVYGVVVEVADPRAGGAARFVARIDLRGLRGPDPAAAQAQPPSGDDVRVLSSARCDELADAVAVVVARLAAELRPPPGPAPDAPATASPAIAARGGAAPAAHPGAERWLPEPWGADLRVLGVSGIGAQPGVSLGGELAGTLRLRSAIVELAGMRWLTSSRAPRTTVLAGADVDLQLAALRIGWGSERLPLRAWLSGELGTLRGGDSDSADPRMASARWLAAGSGFAVAWPMGPWVRLIGMIEVAVPLEQARIVLDGREIYRSAVAAVRSGLGLEIGWL